jgi:hypothetical protein
MHDDAQHCGQGRVYADHEPVVVGGAVGIVGRQALPRPGGARTATKSDVARPNSSATVRCYISEWTGGTVCTPPVRGALVLLRAKCRCSVSRGTSSCTGTI